MDVPATITLGEALPFALVFESRRRAGAEKRAARQHARLETTLLECKALRVRLASLCDAAGDVADMDDDHGTPERERARRSFMLHAARGAVRADPLQGKQRNDLETENQEGEFFVEESSPTQHDCDDSFEFVREARAFRLAELAMAPPDEAQTKQGTQNTQRKGGMKNSATRALGVLRGADDPPAAFAAGTLLLELVGCEVGDGGDSAHASESTSERHSTNLRKPLLPYGVSRVEKAFVAKANVVTAARAFAKTIDPLQGVPSASIAPTFGRLVSAEQLKRDVLSALVHTAAPWRDGTNTQNKNENKQDGEITSARLARVALLEMCSLEILAGDALVLCAIRIRDGVVRLREKFAQQNSTQSQGLGVSTTQHLTPPAGDTKDGMEIDVPKTEETDCSRRADRTADEFEECQKLGFVFEVAERAARTLRGPKAGERPVGLVGTGDTEVSAFDAKARKARDTIAAAAGDSALSAKDKTTTSIAVRLVCTRAIRLHAMTCVALGEKPAGSER